MPTLIATKPSLFSSALEVKQGNQILEELTLKKKWSYALAEVHFNNQTVQFGYTGWTTRKIFIRDTDGNDVATVKNLSWWNRNVSVELNGKMYLWKSKNFWSTRHVWCESDRELMEFRTHFWGNAWDIESNVTLGDTEMLLMAFGLYMLKLEYLDAAAGAA